MDQENLEKKILQRFQYLAAQTSVQRMQKTLIDFWMNSACSANRQANVFSSQGCCSTIYRSHRNEILFLGGILVRLKIESLRAWESRLAGLFLLTIAAHSINFLLYFFMFLIFDKW